MLMGSITVALWIIAEIVLYFGADHKVLYEKLRLKCFSVL